MFILNGYDGTTLVILLTTHNIQEVVYFLDYKINIMMDYQYLQCDICSPFLGFFHMFHIKVTSWMVLILYTTHYFPISQIPFVSSYIYSLYL